MNDRLETGSNRGRTLAAGVMPGARISSGCLKRRSLGAGPQYEHAEAWRQSGKAVAMPFECYGWCRACIDDERADEHFPCLQTCRCGAGAGLTCPGPFRRVGRQPMRSNEDPRERAVVWQRNDDAQARCIRRCIEVAWPQPLWICTDLVALRDTSNSRKKSACWCSESRMWCGRFVRRATAIDESSRRVRTEAGRRRRTEELSASPTATIGCDGRRSDGIRLRADGERFRNSGALRALAASGVVVMEGGGSARCAGSAGDRVAGVQEDLESSERR